MLPGPTVFMARKKSYSSGYMLRLFLSRYVEYSELHRRLYHFYLEDLNHGETRRYVGMLNLLLARISERGSTRV